MLFLLFSALWPLAGLATGIFILGRAAEIFYDGLQETGYAIVFYFVIQRQAKSYTQPAVVSVVQGDLINASA